MIRVLVADDSKIDADLELRALREAGIELEHKVVWTEDTFRKAIDDFVPTSYFVTFSSRTSTGRWRWRFSKKSLLRRR